MMTQLVLDVAIAHSLGNPGPHQLAVAVAQPKDGHLNPPSLRRIRAAMSA